MTPHCRRSFPIRSPIHCLSGLIAFVALPFCASAAPWQESVSVCRDITGYPSVEEEFGLADYVVAGRLIEERLIPDLEAYATTDYRYDPDAFESRYLYSIEISEAFKDACESCATNDNRIITFFGINGSGRLLIEKDEENIVFLHSNKRTGTLYGASCGWSYPLSRSQGRETLEKIRTLSAEPK